MTNGGTQGVAQHFLKYHTDLNVRIRVLNVLPGADKNPPNFMTLLNHAAPLTQEKRPTILDALTDTHQHIDRGLYTYITSYRLSILIDKSTLFINSWLIRL
jgi:hypothetical protein